MNFEQLIAAISQTHDYLQQKAISSVNQSLTIRNWLFGYYLVEYEQNGEDRAQYGGEVLKKIASSLKPTKDSLAVSRAVPFSHFWVSKHLVFETFLSTSFPSKPGMTLHPS